jgi:hypothetical protein
MLRNPPLQGVRNIQTAEFFPQENQPSATIYSQDGRKPGGDPSAFAIAKPGYGVSAFEMAP